MAFRSILFVHLGEGDDAGLRSALGLARRVGARLTLAGAAEQPSLDLLHASGLPPERLERIVLESEGDALEALRARTGADAALPARALRGAPVAAVLREVQEAGHDLVMVSAPPAAGLVERFVPSTALQLLRRCPCPVWLARPLPEAGIRRIGAAVDADAGGERHALDRSILDAAFAVAGACAARVDVLHALLLHPSEAMLRGRGGMSEAEVTALVERIRARAETTMRALVAAAAPPPGVAVTQHVLRGAPGRAVAEFAQQAPLDLLVLGTLGRTGIAGLVIGNTAEDILQRAECSILALKPPGFSAAE
jgi:nucleotide-binding universal stress UspA family protein